MTYVVTDTCINCKYTDCVEVCPVDCFYEGVNTLVIHPEECIDCGVCVPACPVDAIIPDTETGAEFWVEFNQKYATVWPVITVMKPPMGAADRWAAVPDKLPHLDPQPFQQTINEGEIPNPNRCEAGDEQ